MKRFKSGMQEERLSDDFADVVMRGNGLEIFYRSGIHYLPDQEYKINMQIIEVFLSFRNITRLYRIHSRQYIYVYLLGVSL